jgi:dUTP pyrophosphatase
MSVLLEIKFRLNEDVNAQLPIKGSTYSAGYDIHSCVYKVIPPRSRELIHTGVYLEDMPIDHYIRIAPRSGLALKSIDVGAGVVDPDYRGQLGVVLINNSDKNYVVNSGDRIAQLIVEKFSPNTQLVGISSNSGEIIKEFITNNERLEDGFGSTGI